MAIVSVITPTRGRDISILKRCVGSMQLQTLTDFEHIICSEGNEEHEVMDFISGLKDSRFRYRCVGEKTADYGNMARNKMLKWEVSGTYVYFFDDDNICFPLFLERMTQALDTSLADFVVCRAIYYHGSYKIGYIPPRIIDGKPFEKGNVDPVQVVIRSDVMKSVGWVTDNGYSSDGATFSLLAQEHHGIWIDELLSVHL